MKVQLSQKSCELLRRVSERMLIDVANYSNAKSLIEDYTRKSAKHPNDPVFDLMVIQYCMYKPFKIENRIEFVTISTAVDMMSPLIRSENEKLYRAICSSFFGADGKIAAQKAIDKINSYHLKLKRLEEDTKQIAVFGQACYTEDTEPEITLVGKLQTLAGSPCCYIPSLNPTEYRGRDDVQIPCIVYFDNGITKEGFIRLHWKGYIYEGEVSAKCERYSSRNFKMKYGKEKKHEEI